MRRRIALLGTLLLVGCSGAPAAPSTSTTPVAPSPTLDAAATGTSAPASPDGSWLVVALGDSIAYNSPMACPGCNGFVDQYAKRLEAAAGHPVTVKNLSTPMLDSQGLLDQLRDSEARRAAVAEASAVIVGIGFNDVPWIVADDPCDGAASIDDLASIEAAAAKYTGECVAAAAGQLRPKLDAIFAQLLELRAGRPTVFLALNRYNDAIGWCEQRPCPWGSTTPATFVAASRLTVDAWDSTICDAAETHGFTCIDVYHAFNGPQGADAAGDLLAADFIHPSQLGNDRIADLLVAAGFAPLVP